MDPVPSTYHFSLPPTRQFNSYICCCPQSRSNRPYFPPIHNAMLTILITTCRGLRGLPLTQRRIHCLSHSPSPAFAIHPAEFPNRGQPGYSLAHSLDDEALRRHHSRVNIQNRMNASRGFRTMLSTNHCSIQSKQRLFESTAGIPKEIAFSALPISTLT